jgi:tape measure domain-containing protein
MTTERIDIQIREDGSRVVRRNLDDIASAADRVDRAAALMKKTLAGVGVGKLIKETYDLVEEYQKLQNRLGAVGLEGGHLTSVYKRLAAVSNDTRSSVKGTVELFARLALSTKELGVNQQQLITFTKSVNEAILLSGASAKEAENGLIQLSQGMSSNRLSGDELRSVLEQLPIVADVIAKQMGVTRGELRKLGADGKITAKVILDAFKEAEAGLSERFKNLTPTISQAFVILKNNLITAVGELATAQGIIPGVSNAIKGLADSVGTLVNILFHLAQVLAVVTASYLTTQAALKVGAVISAAKEWINLQKAISAGSVVMLGSAEATRQRAVATAQATAADASAAATALKLAQANEALAVTKLADIRATQAMYVAERQLEVIRLQAQINDTGRRLSLARLAELRLAEAALIKIIAKEEQALTLARNASAAAQARAAGAATAGAAATVAAARATTAAATAGTLAFRAQAIAVTALRGALALLGGPIGVVVVGLTLLVSWLVSSKNAAREAAEELRNLNRGALDALNGFKKSPTLDGTVDLSSVQAAIKAQEKAVEAASKGTKYVPYGNAEAQVAQLQIYNTELAKQQNILNNLKSGYEGAVRSTADLIQQQAKLVSVTPQVRAELEKYVKTQITERQTVAEGIPLLVEHLRKMGQVSVANQIAAASWDELGNKGMAVTDAMAKSIANYHNESLLAAATLKGPFAKAQEQLRQLTEEYNAEIKAGNMNLVDRNALLELAKRRFQEEAAASVAKKERPENKLIEELNALPGKYSAVEKAQNDLRLATELLDKAVAAKLITDVKAAEILDRMKFSLKESLDPIAAMHDKFTEEQNLLALNSREREIQIALLEKVRSLQQVMGQLSQEQIDNIRTETVALRDHNEQARIRDDLLANSAANKQREFEGTSAGMAGLLNDPNSGFTQNDALNALNSSGPLAGMFEGTQGLLDQQVDRYRVMYEQIAQLQKDHVITDTQAELLRNKISAEQTQTRFETISDFYGNLASLSRSKNKELARIGRAAAVTQATIDGIAAVQKTLSAYPAPLNFAMAAAVGVSAAANVAQIAGIGFKTGGSFTIGGTGGPDSQIVGIRGTPGERVSIAKPEHVRRGNPYAEGGQGGRSGGGAPNIVINNLGTPQEYELESVTADEVRLIAKDVVRTDAPRVVATEMANPNSEVSRAVGQNTDARRRR